VDGRPDANPDFEKQRADRYRSRIGVDASDSKIVLGIELQLVDRNDGRLQATAPSILEGFPLAKVLPCFEAVAIAFAVRGHADGWEGLKWLCYLNEVDLQPMSDALRALSANVRARAPGAGVHPALPALAAALLLRSTVPPSANDRKTRSGSTALASGFAVAGLPKVIEMLKEGDGEPIWNLSDSLDHIMRAGKAA